MAAGRALEPSATALDVRLRLVESDVEKHDGRLTALERWQWRTTGVLATLATVASLVGSGLIAPLIGHALQ